MIFVHVQGPGHVGGNALLISGEHDGLAHTCGLEGLDAFGGIGLDAVADDHVSGVGAVDGHVDDGAAMLAGMPGGAFGLHEFAVAHSHALAVHGGDDAMAGGLLDALYAAVIGLIGIGVAQRHGNGMRGVALHVRGQVQEFLLVNDFRMHGCYFKYAFGEGSGLVEDHSLNLGQGVYQVGALDEDTLAGGASQAAEEGKRHRNNQGAGAGNHQEHEAPVDPRGPFAGEEAGNHGNEDGQHHYNRRIYTGKLGNEALAPGFGRCGVFHQIQNLSGGGFAEGLGGADAQNAVQVHAAGEDFIALVDAAGYAFAGEGHGVQTGLAFQYNAVHRHFFTRLDEDDFPHGHLVGLHGLQLAVALHVGGIGPNIHQV